MSIARSLVSSTEEVFSSTTSACGAGCERSASEDEVSEVHSRSCCAADSDVTAEVRTVGTSSVCVLVRLIAPASPRVSPATRSPQLMRLRRCSPSLAQLLCAERQKKLGCAMQWRVLTVRGGARAPGAQKESQACVCVRAWAHLRSRRTAGRYRKFMRGGEPAKLLKTKRCAQKKLKKYCAACEA